MVKDKSSLFFLYFLLAFIYLFVVFSPATFIPFAHHDQYRYFANPGNRFRNDPLRGFITGLGRPLTASIQNVVFKNVDNISDLSLVRGIVIFFTAIVLSLLAIWLYSLFPNKAIAFLVSATIFTLPGIQYFVFNGDIPNIVCIFFALLSSLFIQKVKLRDPYHRDFKESLWLLFFFLLSLGSFMVSAFIYTPLTMFFLLPTLAIVLFTSISSWPETRLKVIRDLLLYGSGCVIYFIVAKLCFVPMFNQDDVPAIYKLSITSNIPSKIAFFKEISIRSLNLWNIHPNKTIYLVLILIILAGALVAAIRILSRNRNVADKRKHILFMLQIAIAVGILLLASNTVNLVASGGAILYRTIFVYMAMITLLLIWCFSSVRYICPVKLQVKIVGTIICAIFVGASIIAYRTTRHNTLNSYIEFSFVCREIAKHGDKKISRIHLIRAKPNGRGFNNRLSSPSPYGDEFNVNSTQYVQDIPFIIRAALLELNLKGGHFIVTNSAFGEPIPASPNTVIIDMNRLINKPIDSLIGH